jgi:transposase
LEWGCQLASKFLTHYFQSRQHINGIEDFWGYAKIKLKSYYGVSREHFYFYLKEMGFRFNHRKAANLAALIKKIVRKHQAVLD